MLDSNTQHHAATTERPTKQALLRGWRRRCPNCGKGPMMNGYLKVRDACPICAEPLSGHRADDGPAYLTILVVGKVLAPLMIWAYATFRPEPMVLASVFVVGAITMALWLLPRFKGAVVALQWAKRMHGFSDL